MTAALMSRKGVEWPLEGVMLLGLEFDSRDRPGEGSKSPNDDNDEDSDKAKELPNKAKAKGWKQNRFSLEIAVSFMKCLSSLSR